MMSGFVRDEKCAFPRCRKKAPIIYDTVVDPDIILMFCQTHIPKVKLAKEIRIINGQYKGRKFGLALASNEDRINWIKKCKANADVNLDIDESGIEVITK